MEVAVGGDTNSRDSLDVIYSSSGETFGINPKHVNVLNDALQHRNSIRRAPTRKGIFKILLFKF